MIGLVEHIQKTPQPKAKYPDASQGKSCCATM